MSYVDDSQALEPQSNAHTMGSAHTGEAAVAAAITAFLAHTQELDRTFRKRGETVPTDEQKQALAGTFWLAVAKMGAVESPSKALIAECREALGPWLFRSRYWNRSFHKPHGYAGDFRMLEWIYDLETDGCADPTQPAIVNCLDYLYYTVHSVQSVWERRRWFAKRLSEEQARTKGELRVLDVACGGARYIRDFLEALGDRSQVALTLIDQDAAALAFCREIFIVPLAPQAKVLNFPIVKLPEILSHGEYDIIVSTGLFDYLDDAIASRLLAHLRKLTAPGGLIAISNFHPADQSRLVKDWLVDWPLIFRNEADCKRIFPADLTITTEISANGALTYASARVE